MTKKKSLKERILIWTTGTSLFILCMTSIASYFLFESSIKITAMGAVHNRLKTVESLLLWEKDKVSLKKLVEERWSDIPELQWIIAICEDNSLTIKTQKLSRSSEELAQNLCAANTSLRNGQLQKNIDSLDYFGEIRRLENYRILVAVTAPSWVFLRNELFYIFSTILLFAGFLIFIVNRVISKYISVDVNNLVEKILHVDFKKQNAEISLQTDTKEIGVLVENFNSLLHRLNENYRRIDNFSEDLAHEIKTPLQRMRSAIESALQGHPSNQIYEETLVEQLQEILRISKIADSLLFLAKANYHYEKISKSICAIDSLTRDAIDFFEDKFIAKHIQVNTSQLKHFELIGYKDLLQQALGNLISNAVRYTPTNGKISISSKVRNGLLLISVEDSGPGISDKFLNQAKERFAQEHFYRGGNHVGLGLSIVEKIADIHQGTFILKKSKKLKGLKAVILLPYQESATLPH